MFTGTSEAGRSNAARTPVGSKAQIHTLPRPWSAAASIMWSHAMEASMSVEAIPSKERFQARSASAHTTNASGAPYRLADFPSFASPSALSTWMRRTGWRFAALGATCAASTMAAIFSGSTGRGS